MQGSQALLALAALAVLLSAASALGQRRGARRGGARRRDGLLLSEAAAAAGALIAVGVLVTLLLGRGARQEPRPQLEAAEVAGVSGGAADDAEKDITVTTVTRIRTRGTVAAATHRLDSIFVSIASYRCAALLLL